MAKQKTLTGEFGPNAARYRQASEPHESEQAAKKAIQDFYDELAELRVKHQIKDLYVIYNVAMLEKDGEESAMTGATGFGTQSLWLSMAACAYGTEKEKHERNIRRLLACDPEAVARSIRCPRNICIAIAANSSFDGITGRCRTVSACWQRLLGQKESACTTKIQCAKIGFAGMRGNYQWLA